MKKNLLIIYAKNSIELTNRQSALGSYIFCLCDLLEKNNFNVYVNEFSFYELKNANRLSQNINQQNNPIKKLIPNFFKEIKRDKKLFAIHKQTIAKISTNISFDAILEFYTYGSVLGPILKKQFNASLITVFDSPVLEEHQFFNGKKRFNKMKIEGNQRRSLIESDQIVVYSNPVKKYVASITNKNDNISIHQNVDFTRFDFIEPRVISSEINIGFIGSFLKWHRVDLLINIFEKLAKTNLSVKLFLIGAGMEFEKIKKQVSNSPAKARIELTGFCDGEKLLKYKKILHIGVMPGSNWYGAPNKIFEYGAAGLAVMAPATPTITDIFNNQNEILLFEWDNEKSGFDALKRLVEEKSLIKLLQFNLQKKIRKDYSESHTINFYSTVINKALNRK